MIISKCIEWDMGHRVMNHNSKCRNLHGHRYKAEISVEGDLILLEGYSDEGMVMDFGLIKDLALKYIHDVLDHAFMVWGEDEILINFFQQNPDQKHLVVPFVPTSENIARWIFTQLEKKIDDKYKTDLKLKSIKLWETPTSTAICTKEDIDHEKI